MQGWDEGEVFACQGLVPPLDSDLTGVQLRSSECLLYIDIVCDLWCFSVIVTTNGTAQTIRPSADRS
jgi:hypothetical protein